LSKAETGRRSRPPQKLTEIKSGGKKSTKGYRQQQQASVGGERRKKRKNRSGWGFFQQKRRSTGSAPLATAQRKKKKSRAKENASHTTQGRVSKHETLKEDTEKGPRATGGQRAPFREKRKKK